MLVDDSWYQELQLGKIKSIVPVSGGDINLAFKIITDESEYFLKVQPNNDESFFLHEKEGLDLMGAVINAPKVIRIGTFKGCGYLIQNFIEFGQGSQFELGQMVAKLHQKHAPKFGLDNDVLNAKNPKINTWQTNWGKFFIEQRLEVLLDKVKAKGYWNNYRQDLFDKFEKRVSDFYQENPVKPSLLHGDLWNGNVAFTKTGSPILFDPDVFYGNREMDIAMTLLFGGFNADFYQGYESVYPLTKDWQKRIPWYQSYYLLAHVNLFGETYGPSLEQTLIQSLQN
ncbi:fructosamine kinase family protein [Companilactobacillus sp. HBUAS59544]|uniref:fructosamine kinase family protein n=1 Tax=Companilactobacillus sp. HBUAS59544 TaxID=3109363 RepID=UPI002FF1E745